MWSVIICGLVAVFMLGGVQQAAYFPLSLTPIPAVASLAAVGALCGLIGLASRGKASRTNSGHAVELESIRHALTTVTGVEFSDQTVAHLLKGRRLVLSSGSSVWTQRYKDEVVFVMSKIEPPKRQS